MVVIVCQRMKLNPPRGCEYDILDMIGMDRYEAKILTSRWSDMADEEIEKNGHFCPPRIMYRGLTEFVSNEKELVLFMYWISDVSAVANDFELSSDMPTPKILKGN